MRNVGWLNAVQLARLRPFFKRGYCIPLFGVRLVKTALGREEWFRSFGEHCRWL